MDGEVIEKRGEGGIKEDGAREIRGTSEKGT